MSNELRPKWAEERLSQILETTESILFETKGRVETKPPSGIGAIFYWISYIFVNYISIFVTARYIFGGYLVMTDKSYKHQDYFILNDKVGSVSLFESKVMWVVSSKGLLIESVGSLSMIFNGVSKEKYQEVKSLQKK
jgi:hypothetical protein